LHSIATKHVDFSGGLIVNVLQKMDV